MRDKREKLTNLAHRLEKRDPNGPLEKGFVRVWQEEQWVRKRVDFTRKKEFELEWNDGKMKIQ
jgi:exodeoxyribonuclease VII large subunit